VLFVLLRLLPGDPANAVVSVGADPQQIEAAREQVGSNLPLAEQFLRFVISLARFDLGKSFISGAPVGAEIAARLAVTLPLTLLASALAVIIAVPLGIIAAVKADRWYGALISTVSQLGIAVPVFWIGILLVTGFAEALIRHGIRNASVPVVSILGIELATALLGAVVAERVFALPGLGSMLLLGIQQRDYPNVQGVLFISTLLVLLVGFAADLVQRLIDPRLRERTVGLSS
jgi:peptide/nickel transport system permease protein